MTRSPLSVALGAALLSLGLGLPVAAGPVPLAEEAHITENLVAAQAGDILRKTCPTISVRWFTFYEMARALEDYARGLGYTEEEVRAFLKDKDEKARIKALAADYLTAAGVVEGAVETYCQAGRDEIAKATLAGQLLRSSE